MASATCKNAHSLGLVSVVRRFSLFVCILHHHVHPKKRLGAFHARRPRCFAVAAANEPCWLPAVSHSPPPCLSSCFHAPAVFPSRYHSPPVRRFFIERAVPRLYTRTLAKLVYEKLVGEKKEAEGCLCCRAPLNFLNLLNLGSHRRVRA